MARKAAHIVGLVNDALGADTLRWGDDEHFRVTVIPTGVLPVDDLLQGGLPRGRWTELFGSYSSLKSFIAYSAVAQCQAAGGIAALIDTEHAYDPDWCSHIGVDVSDLILEQPATAEIAIDVTEVLVRNGVDLVVWDSVAAMTPQAEAAKREAGENANVAELARLMSRAMRKITAANHRTAILYCNQTRDNIGVTFGPRETTPGGNAPRFYASHRVSLKKGGKVTTADKMWTGSGRSGVRIATQQKVKAELHKSKLTTPQREVWMVYDMLRGEVDEGNYILARALQEGLVAEKGGWWTVKGSKKKYRAKTLAEELGDSRSQMRKTMTTKLFPWRQTT